jgi:hypothetical protein
MKKLIFVSSFIFALNVCANTPVHHEITATIQPNQSLLSVEDEMTILVGKSTKTLQFKLHHNLIIKKNKLIKKIKSNVDSQDIGMDKDDVNEDSALKLNVYQIQLPRNTGEEFKISVSYSGKIESPVKQSAENYARGFSESAGIIFEKGVYLAGSTYWVPTFDEQLVTFNLTTTVPKDWRVVTTGQRSKDKTDNTTHTYTWNSPTPQEEVFLIAAAFSQYSYSMGNVEAMAFLRTPDEGLANKYLETTAQYMEMYRKLIGPYPYTKFALVENFWETGYGMPSFTLLGEKIIRFPFILHSSYPHELLHNWWGNSVYVDFDNGNWCEGLTAYMADHLIKEQRHQGEEYRRATLQKFTNFVNKQNDFPLNKFISRHDAASEAIGYGKTLMLNHMLRQKVGDEDFIKSYQQFNRDNKFKRASFDDIRQAFESTTDQKLDWYFKQWIDRTGAPSLTISDVKKRSVRGQNTLTFTLNQIQEDNAFSLDIPLAIVTGKGTSEQTVSMDNKTQSYNLAVDGEVLKIQIDPHFDVFRTLDPRESPPAFTKAYGADKTTIILPAKTNKRYALYQDLATKWSQTKADKFEILAQNDLIKLPTNQAVMILGLDNKFSTVVNKALKQYNSNISPATVSYSNRIIKTNDNSFFIAVANPKNIAQTITLLSIGNDAAVDGLVRKLPHYGKYSYLAFEGDEPTNIAKGNWQITDSPLIYAFDKNAKVELEKRQALATLAPVFSAKQMMESVNYLADDKLKGRQLGSPELDEAAQFIAKKFKQYGLKAGGNNGSYLQTWAQDVKDKKNIHLSNVIGIIPGINSDLSKAVVLSAHYDHLGLGWPNHKSGNQGKIHNGADDNASGVAVMLELARTLGKSAKPARTIIFVAFTGEEAGLIGSEYFVKEYLKHNKIFANINIDTVGRLFDNKLMVINANTAREWKFIFMGTDFTTGVSSQIVTQELDASDQVSFIKAQIPAVQLFYAGIKSDYHVPADTADKIDSAGLIKVASVAKEIIEYLAERKDPMPFTGKGASTQHSQAKANTATRKASTGSMPDFAYSGVGVKIAGIADDSPAAKAGLKTGDIIIGFNSNPIKNLKDYSNQLKAHQPGDTVEVTVTRDKQELTVMLTLGAR